MLAVEESYAWGSRWNGMNTSVRCVDGTEARAVNAGAVRPCVASLRLHAYDPNIVDIGLQTLRRLRCICPCAILDGPEWAAVCNRRESEGGVNRPRDGQKEGDMGTVGCVMSFVLCDVSSTCQRMRGCVRAHALVPQPSLPRGVRAHALVPQPPLPRGVRGPLDA